MLKKIRLSCITLWLLAFSGVLMVLLTLLNPFQFIYGKSCRIPPYIQLNCNSREGGRDDCCSLILERKEIERFDAYNIYFVVFFLSMPSGSCFKTMMTMMLFMMPALTLGDSNISVPIVDTTTERNDFNSLIYGVGNVPTLKKDSDLLSDIPTLIYFAVIFMVFIIGDQIRDQ